MLYYMELDKTKEKLEIKQADNIHRLSKEIRVAWTIINDYINGQEVELPRLSCGVKFPLLKKLGEKMWLVYEDVRLAEYYNYRWMSKEVWDDLSFMSNFTDIWAISNKTIKKDMGDDDDE